MSEQNTRYSKLKELGYPHQQKYKDSMIEMGFVKVSVWVPREQRNTIRRIAEGMRDDAKQGEQ